MLHFYYFCALFFTAMRNFYIPIIAFFLCVCPMLTPAAPVDPLSAKNVALGFVNAHHPTRSDNQVYSVTTPFQHLFVFNVEGGGFVVVSGDDRTRPVLAYSESGSFESSDMPEALTGWLSLYEVQLKSLADGAQSCAYQPTRNDRAVSPLIATRWNQSSPNGNGYNALCPVDTSLPQYGGHPAVGCVALALGQVMRYWQWPLQGRGSHAYSLEGSYSCWHYDTLSANFGATTYDWAHMPIRLTDSSSQAERTAVATLLYHCGVAVNMRYNSDCNGSSAALMSSQYYGATRFFGYSNSATLCERANYTDAQWKNLIKNDLDNQIPVLYSGSSYYDPVNGTYSGAHAFIIDGYDNDDYFHVNWGWGGSYDAYFAIEALTPYYYNFSHDENATFGLVPATTGNPPFTDLLQTTSLDTDRVQKGGVLGGHSRMVNVGDTTDDFFVGQAIIENLSQQFVKWLDVQHLTIAAGDTLQYAFQNTVDLPVGSYYVMMYRSSDSIDINASNTLGDMQFPAQFRTDIDFWMVDSNRSELTNLVIFIRFADDEEITHDFAQIDTMFNGKTPGFLSVYNFFETMSYGKIRYVTKYANQVYGNHIVSYMDAHPRGYYEPYSPTNPDGYQGPNPFVGISMREAQLLAAAMQYVNNNGLVDTYVTLDGDGDGYIDNVSFIVKGGTGAWASILWPHMEFFPHDSIDYPVRINGMKPNTFNFEFEGASSSLFSANVFRHEMGHSLNMPDLYHYTGYSEVDPAGYWDMMCRNYAPNHTNMMFKSKILRVADEPVEITEDGDYTLLSNATSPTQSCYYIRSAIDSTQWFTLEYRNQADLFDEGIPGTGLIIGRWNDTVPLNYQGMFANAFFDYEHQAHQYWIFRPGSNCDTMNGDINMAHFCAAEGRTSFGPTTDPYPYLTDGTPENSFEITNIQENGSNLTFHVHFFNSGVHDATLAESVRVYPNPAFDQITVSGQDLQRIEIYSLTGQLLMSESCSQDQCRISIGQMPSGVLLLKVMRTDGSMCVRKVVKR